jgi:hypothetical protein
MSRRIEHFQLTKGGQRSRSRRRAETSHAVEAYAAAIRDLERSARALAHEINGRAGDEFLSYVQRLLNRLPQTLAAVDESRRFEPKQPILSEHALSDLLIADILKNERRALLEAAERDDLS